MDNFKKLQYMHSQAKKNAESKLEKQRKRGKSDESGSRNTEKDISGQRDSKP